MKNYSYYSKYAVLIMIVILSIILSRSYLFEQLPTFDELLEENKVKIDSQVERVLVRLNTKILSNFATEVELDAQEKVILKEFGSKLKKRDCNPIKDKRSFKVNLGEFEIIFKKGETPKIKGLEISRSTGDAIIQQILIYDKALSAICFELSKIDYSDPAQAKVAFYFLDKQEVIIKEYSKYQIAFQNKASEEEIKKIVESNKSKVDSTSTKKEISSTKTDSLSTKK